MNCFMGYNPLVTKQVKVTVWVCEQDGASPVAPSNPSEGDCFIVYATDEAMLSNTPTSKKTYTNGDWADAEGGGGGATIPTVTTSNDNTYTCDIGYDGWHSLIENSIYEESGNKAYPTWILSPPPPGVPGGLAGAFFSSKLDDNGISVAVDEQAIFIFHDDGTFEITE